MRMNNRAASILHVEDDPALATLVGLTLKRLGFAGEIHRAGLVSEALTILEERYRQKAPLNLVLLDMQLPDGSGLDVLRQIRSSPMWQKIPVIILSGEMDTRIIDEAYALGANCYLPKISKIKGGLGSIRALYECWIEGALVPEISFTVPAVNTIATAARLRAQIAKFYFRLARIYEATPDQGGFWLERAMIEGNMSNLLTFLQEQVVGQGFSQELVERTVKMQGKVQSAANAAEAILLSETPPETSLVLTRILDLLEATDEGVIIDIFKGLFSNHSALAHALKSRVLGQLRAMAGFVLQQSQDSDFCRRAEALLEFSNRLEAVAA